MSGEKFTIKRNNSFVHRSILYQTLTKKVRVVLERMAIDHGLGGRESDKSRQRRLKKAASMKRLVVESTKASSTSRKGEVVFNESSRLDFIQGFRKRKAERRKHGLTMELLKQQKARREARKDLRLGSAAGLSLPAGGDEEDGDGDGDDIETSGEAFHDNDNRGGEGSKDTGKLTRVEFSDSHTQDMFDGTVTVEVDEGIDDDMDNLLKNYDTDKTPQSSSWGGKGPTRYEKAQKIVKETMGNKKKRKTNNNTAHSVKSGAGKRTQYAKNQEAKSLLRKAVGDKAGGKFKGKMHKSKAMKQGGRR